MWCCVAVPSHVICNCCLANCTDMLPNYLFTFGAACALQLQPMHMHAHNSLQCFITACLILQVSLRNRLLSSVL